MQFSVNSSLTNDVYNQVEWWTLNAPDFRLILHDHSTYVTWQVAFICVKIQAVSDN